MATSLGIGGQIVTDGLVLCLDAANKDSYPGTGTTWYDLSGNGYDGTLVNSPVFEADKLGNFNFDGSDECVNIGTDTAYNSLTQITGEAIFRPEVAASYQYIASNARDCCGVYNGFNFYLNSSRRLEAMIWNSANYDGSNWPTSRDVVSGNTLLTLNNWYHVAFTYDNSDLVLYLNGINNGSKSTAFGIGTPASYTLRVGAMGLSNIYDFNGNIAFFRLYNRALTASEISNNFLALRARFGL